MNTWAWFVATLVFIGIGVLVVRTPVERHLQWDRKTGYWIYRKRLEKTGDEKQAIAAAAAFYRLFGSFFIVIGAVQSAIVVAMFLSRLVGAAPN